MRGKNLEENRLAALLSPATHAPYPSYSPALVSYLAFMMSRAGEGSAGNMSFMGWHRSMSVAFEVSAGNCTQQ